MLANHQTKVYLFFKSVIFTTTIIASLSAQSQSISEMLTPVQKESSVPMQSNRPQLSLTSKEEFFREAAKGGTWWEEWGHHRYADGGASNSMIERSAVVKNILEREWKVTIPFQPGLIAAVRGSRVREALKGGKLVPNRSGTNWCDGLTPVDLASSVAAVTAYVAPEYTYPNGTPNNVRQNAKEYLQAIFMELNTYCSPLDKGAFVSAFKNFLDEYARVIEAPYAQAQAAVLAAEDAKRKEDAERKAAEAATAAIAAKKKTEQLEQEKIAAKAREHEANERWQRQRDENERKRTEATQYASDLRSGKVTPRVLNDFVVLHNAEPGFQIIVFPPLEPDKKIYAMSGRLEREDGNLLVFSFPIHNDIKYFAVRTVKTMFKEDGFTLRFEYPAKVIGRLVGTQSYTTIAGMQRQMPVFEGIAIGTTR